MSIFFSCLIFLEFYFIHFSNKHMCIPLWCNRPPIIEVKGKLSVATYHLAWLHVYTCKTVVPTCSSSSSFLRFWNSISPFRCVVHNTNPFWYSRTHTSTGTIHSVIVIDLYPIIIFNSKESCVFFAHPAGFHTS